MVSPGPVIQSLLLDIAYPPRRLLLHASLFTHHTPPASPSSPAPPSAAPTTAPAHGEPSFDANVIMILAVLLCALICAVGLNSVVRCALRCSATPSLSAPLPRCGGNGGGVKKAALKSIPTMAYTEAGRMPCGSWSECAICLSDFSEGERVRVLPGCNHGFHVRCIDRWLKANATCPTCRSSCLCSGLKKAVRTCDGPQLPTPSSPPPPPPPQQPPRASAIRPLDHEGVLVEGMLVGYMGRL